MIPSSIYEMIWDDLNAFLAKVSEPNAYFYVVVINTGAFNQMVTIYLRDTRKYGAQEFPMAGVAAVRYLTDFDQRRIAMFMEECLKDRKLNCKRGYHVKDSSMVYFVKPDWKYWNDLIESERVTGNG